MVSFLACCWNNHLDVCPCARHNIDDVAVHVHELAVVRDAKDKGATAAQEVVPKT